MGDISKHFDRAEFACKCGCGYDTVDYTLLEALEALRSHFKAPIVVTSGCRCEAHNEAVGGSENSQHKLGRAADIKVRGATTGQVAMVAHKMGMSVGHYDTFTHVDSRTGTPVKWRG